MKRVPKIVYLTLAVLIAVGGVIINGIDRVRAVEPGVYIVPIEDATKGFACSDLNARTDEVFGGVTSDFGFKLGGIPDLGLNTYPFITTGDNELTGGAPSDPSNSVTIEGIDNFSFNWWATLGIDAVIVKASTDAEVYVYIPEAFEGGPLYSVMKADGSYFAISHIEFCYDYEVSVSKTAETSFTRTWQWDITKTANESYDLFKGDQQDHEFEIKVFKTGFTDSDWAVSGLITIVNNTPLVATIESVSDVISESIPGVVSCPVSFPYDLAAGANLECSYTAALPDAAARTNTATVLTSGIVGGEAATIPFDFSEAVITEEDTSVDVYDGDVELGTATDDDTFYYTATYTCDDDEGMNENTASFVASDTEATGAASAAVTITCHDLQVVKTANTSFTRTYKWKIEKDFDASYDLFAGEFVSHGYKVAVTPDGFVDSHWAVSGVITVTNPAPLDAEITALSDALDLGVQEIAATVDCGVVEFPYILASEASLVCSYSANAGGAWNGTNTATASLQNYHFKLAETVKLGTTNFNGSAAVDFSKAAITEVNKDITVDDDNLTDEVWSASGAYAEWLYTKDFACSADPDDYTDGSYSYQHINTATINETGQKDSATVDVTCYAPVVSKDAAGTFDKTYTWDVEKTVDPTGDSGMPGDTLSWTWTVTVTKIPAADKNFAVSGTISVTNPHPTSAMTVALADVLSDGTIATIEYCATPAAEFVPIDGQISVPALTTAVCWYTASPATKAELNTVTATLNAIDFAANAVIGWTGNESGDSAELDDDQNPAFPITITEGGTWTYSDSHTCSTYRWDYDQETHRYNSEVNNTATVTWEDGSDSDSAKTSYACKAGFVDLTKLTNGLEDPEEVWTFNLYKGGYEGTLIASGTTPPTLLFADLALPFYTEYTMCEIGAPAGWISAWTMNGESVTPYNPDYPENLGNLCVDFYVGTTEIVDGKLRITGPTTVSFVVDNQQGGGDPRTPGYWKNWNTCTGGNQQYTAAANGGWAEGFWLLDDVLGLTDAPSPGIIWDDILIDEFEFPINSCALGVSILNTRDFSTGKQLAGDPGYNLAKHLLAAQANLIAGACMPYPETGVDINDIILQAETLLDEHNFDATGVGIDKKKDKADAAYALELASILDEYNNGLYCGSTFIP